VKEMTNEKRYNLIFFTGAGISKESGIPTFAENPYIRDRLSRSFAIANTQAYENTLKLMKEQIEGKLPNTAHYAIAATGAPVLTMNVDKLHDKAGSDFIINLHGTIDNPILYSDPAPAYKDAIALVKKLKYADSYFIIIGISFYTEISNTLLKYAKGRKAKVIIINEDAATRVPLIITNKNLVSKGE
jgi:NAD-dependent deacetylase